MMKKYVLLFCLLYGSLLWGQTSTLTATITDSDSQTWNNGTYTITLHGVSGVSSYYWNGVLMTPAQLTYSGSMNPSGVITIAIPDNAFINPVATQWDFKLCPASTASCANVTTTVTGASPDLSTVLSAGLAGPRLNATAMPKAYNPTEIINTSNGSFYYDLLNGAQLYSSNAWGSFGSGGGGGGITNTAGVNVVPKSDGTNLVGSNFSDDGSQGLYSGPNGFSATNGISTGAGAPSSCSGSGCWATSQAATNCTPSAGVNCLQADSATGAWLQTLGTNTAVPVPNAATPPLALSANGTLSIGLGTGSVAGALQCDNTTTTCSGGVISSTSSGGGGAFTYFQTPSGTINGVNTAFTVSAAPSPGVSLQLMLSGIMLAQGVDYTLSGAAITMTGSVPRTGESFKAIYQVAAGATYSYFETPGGTINSVNGTYTLAHPPSPQTSLQLFLGGVTMVPGVDYTLTSSTVTFTAGAVPQTGTIMRAIYTY